MIEHLITTYGYAVIFFGTIVEGETPLVMGGFAAHRGYLSLPIVVLVAFLGSVAGDQTYFYLGRKQGERFLVRRPRWRASLERVDRLLSKHPVLFVMGFRFLYGLRTVSPFAIGMTSISARKFTALNFAGAALWAVSIGGAGYVFGSALEVWLGRAERYEAATLATLATIGLLVWLGHQLRNRRRAAAVDQSPTPSSSPGEGGREHSEQKNTACGS